MPSRRRPSDGKDIALITEPTASRKRIEGVDVQAARIRSSITGVDFVDCDLTGLGLHKARFGKPPVVRDCTFTDCDWGGNGHSGVITKARLVDCLFADCRIGWLGIVASTLDGVRFERTRFGSLHLDGSTLIGVQMVDVAIGKSHWEHSELRSVSIAGRAKTLVLSDTSLEDVDLSGLMMVDCDVGERVGTKVRFPASPDSFVIRGRALDDVDRELAAHVSPAGMASFREMRRVLMSDYVVIDPRLFGHAPDLPDMETTPADVDAIIGALWAHVVLDSDH